jgi:hypothetical protein
MGIFFHDMEKQGGGKLGSGGEFHRGIFGSFSPLFAL